MINDKEFEDFVFLQALENAISFGGSANSKALIGKCVPKFPDMKSDMAHYSNLINNVCEQVNSMPVEEQTKKLKSLGSDFFDKKVEKKEPEKKDGLPVLTNTDKGVVVRFPPAPSGHLHLGHLFGIIANYELKKKYGGKFILRFEDTNPENIDISNYDKVIEDVNWICDGEVDEIVYQSDRLSIYYKYMRTLFELGHCYVCECDSETFKAYTDAKQACPHRKMLKDKQVEIFEKFMRGELENNVLRANADLENKNPALRSFALARIVKTPHARAGTKYSVWPNYNFACAIDDSVMGLTHVVRGKDLEIGEPRQKMIMSALGLHVPQYFHYGRMKFEDVELSKTKLSELIESGKYSGWDDPRVPSILSYRKRGYKAKAFRDFIKSLGITKRDSRITSEEYNKGLDFFNKQILEKEADRFFFVHNPKKVHINNIEDIKDKEILLPKHPEDKSRSNRKFLVESDYLIDGIDFDNLEKGDKLRLMHFGNFEIVSKSKDLMELKFISKDYDKNFASKRNIHFVSAKGNESVTIVMQDNSNLKGLCEDLDNIKVNGCFQFERFGFVKFDSKDDKGNKLFYFTHR